MYLHYFWTCDNFYMRIRWNAYSIDLKIWLYYGCIWWCSYNYNLEVTIHGRLWSYTLKLRWTCHTVTIPLGPDLNIVSNTNFVSTFCATIKQFLTWFGRRYLVSITTAVMQCIKEVWSEIWQEMCENCYAINQIEERVDNASHSPPHDKE